MCNYLIKSLMPALDVIQGEEKDFSSLNFVTLTDVVRLSCHCLI